MTAIDQTPDIKLESQRLADNLLRRAAEFFRTHEQRIYRRAASFFARLTVMSVVEAFTRPLRELERLAHARPAPTVLKQAAHALATLCDVTEISDEKRVFDRNGAECLVHASPPPNA